MNTDNYNNKEGQELMFPIEQRIVIHNVIHVVTMNACIILCI